VDKIDYDTIINQFTATYRREK